MQAGFACMNDLTVIQASQGLAAYLLSTSASAPSVVIGHDHRYNSEKFARLAAAAMIQRGIKVPSPSSIATPETTSDQL